MLYVFGRIWVDIFHYDVYYIVVDQCFCYGIVFKRWFVDFYGWHFCWCVDVDLVHSDGGMYFQSFCLQQGKLLIEVD